MQPQLSWLLQLLITAIPGFVNVWLSHIEQTKYFQQKFPIFRPISSKNWWALATATVSGARCAFLVGSTRCISH